MANKTSDLYQADGGKAYHDAIHGGLGEYGYSLVAKRRAAKMQDYILPTDQVFEYGIGPGWNLAKIKAKSLKGFDVSESVRNIVESKGIEFVTKITTNDFSSYDVVICSHVLEHLEKPADGLITILNCLKPNGKALLYVPFDIGRVFRKYDDKEPNHHLYGWSVQSFGNFLSLNGFTILEGKLRSFGHERFAAKFCERLKLPYWVFKFLLRIALFIKPAHEIAFVATKP